MMALTADDLSRAVELAEDHVVMHRQALTEAVLDFAEARTRVERARREHQRSLEHVGHLRNLLDGAVGELREGRP